MTYRSLVRQGVCLSLGAFVGFSTLAVDVSAATGPAQPAGVVNMSATSNNSNSSGYNRRSGTLTPIQHVVVIFQENVSFDHYFATYPNALNPPGCRLFMPNRAPAR